MTTTSPTCGSTTRKPTGSTRRRSGTPGWASPPTTRTGRRGGSRPRPCACRWWPRWTTGRSVPPTGFGGIGSCGCARGRPGRLARPRPRPGRLGGRRGPGRAGPDGAGRGAAAAPAAGAGGAATARRRGRGRAPAARPGTVPRRLLDQLYPGPCLVRRGQAGQGRLDSGSRLLPEGAGPSAEGGRRP